MTATRLLALASMTALAAAAFTAATAGCSSSGGGGGDAQEAGVDATPGADAGKKDTEAPDANTVNPSCPTTAPLAEADLAKSWLAPTIPAQDVCDQGNIDALKAAFKTAPATGLPFADIKAALGATCAACVFSPIAGPTWQVFVEDDGGALDNRTGSCFAQLANVDCGRKRAKFEDCLEAACTKANCGMTASVLSDCHKTAQNGACLDVTTAYVTACPGESTDLPLCGNLFAAIGASCAGGKDAGIDASNN